MGLIARVIEAAGIPTVAISLAREVTEQVKPPRAIYLRFPFGHPMGEPNNINQQFAVLRDCMKALKEIEEPGTIINASYRWRRTQYEPVDFEDIL